MEEPRVPAAAAKCPRTAHLFSVQRRPLPFLLQRGGVALE